MGAAETHGGLLPSLLALVLVVVVITLGVHTQVQSTLVQGALQQQAASLAGLVQGVLGTRIPAAHLRVAAQPAQRAWWATRVQQLRRIDPAVGPITVWDLTGRCVYATDPHQIGHRAPHDPHLHLALQGQPTAVLEQERTAPVPGQSGERGRAPATHLAAYIPLPGPQGRRGAYEVDSVAAPLTRQVAPAQHRIGVLLGGERDAAHGGPLRRAVVGPERSAPAGACGCPGGDVLVERDARPDESPL